MDGTDLTAFPAERTLDPAKPHWFLDVQQTGYCLPAGQNVTVARKHQTSRDVNDLENTEGDFLTAWIDHGQAPQNASYEYLLAVRATPQTLRQLAADPPYRVLQRDDAAHIVWDTAGRRWGCVFFAPQEELSHSVAKETLPVKAVDRPCLVMAQAARDGTGGRECGRSRPEPGGQSEPAAAAAPHPAWLVASAGGAAEPSASGH